MGGTFHLYQGAADCEQVSANGHRETPGAKLEFEQMERDKNVQSSTLPSASPLHMVMKKDGT
jgi:hypothetical protein